MVGKFQTTEPLWKYRGFGEIVTCQKNININSFPVHGSSERGPRCLVVGQFGPDALKCDPARLSMESEIVCTGAETDSHVTSCPCLSNGMVMHTH